MAASPDAAQTLSPARRAPTRRYEARRQAILASAVQELNHKGFRGMTLGDVAARLDLVPTGVIYYFRNKEELAGACFQAAIERFDSLIAEGMAAGDSDAARITGFIDAFFRYRQAAEHGQAEEIAVFNDVRGLNSQPVLDAFVGMFRNARELIQGPLEARLPRQSRNLRTHLLLSEIFWTDVWVKNSVPEDYGRLGARMAAILTEGLIAPGASWPTFDIPTLPADGEGEADASEPFLRAATELINKEGYHGASVERISARLNVSKGAFYHHNETKDELVVACFVRTCEIMWRAIRAAEAQGGSGLKVLAQISASLVRFQLEGDLPLLRTSALSAVPEAIRPGLVARYDRIAYRIASIICDGVADGSIRPVDANIAAQMITSTINAACELEDWAPGLHAADAETRYVRPLFEGLLSPLACG